MGCLSVIIPANIELKKKWIDGLMEIEYLEIFNRIKGNESCFDIKRFMKLMEKGLLREDLVREYAFAVPNLKAIKEVIRHSPIIEIGAGSGYWSYLINKYGGNIIAFDDFSRNNEWNEEREGVMTKPYFLKKWYDIKKENEEIITKYPNHTLFLCWVDHFSEMGLNCLKLYKEAYFIYIGESEGGCCANDSFFEYLENNFKLIKEINIPQWYGSHDFLEIYKRK